MAVVGAKFAIKFGSLLLDGLEIHEIDTRQHTRPCSGVGSANTSGVFDLKDKVATKKNAFFA